MKPFNVFILTGLFSLNSCGGDSLETHTGGSGSSSLQSASCIYPNLKPGSEGTYLFTYKESVTLLTARVVEETPETFNIEFTKKGQTDAVTLYKECNDTGNKTDSGASGLDEKEAYIVYGSPWDPARELMEPKIDELPPPEWKGGCEDEDSAQTVTVQAGTFLAVRCTYSPDYSAGTLKRISENTTFLANYYDASPKPFRGVIQDTIKYTDGSVGTVELIQWNGI